MPSPRIYKNDHQNLYFLTLTTLQWVNLFESPKYFECLASALRYAIQKKGLILVEYVFMTNHIHLLAQASENGKPLSDIIRDFKKFTTHECKTLVRDDHRLWVKWIFHKSFTKTQGNDFQLWQRGNWPEVISSEAFLFQKTKYIWNNPVKKGYVLRPEDWYYSSARQKLLGLPYDHPEIAIPCTEWGEAVSLPRGLMSRSETDIMGRVHVGDLKNRKGSGQSPEPTTEAYLSEAKKKVEYEKAPIKRGIRTISPLVEGTPCRQNNRI